MAFGDVVNLQGDASDLLNEMSRAAEGVDALGTTLESFARKWAKFQEETKSIANKVGGKAGAKEYIAELKGRLKQEEAAREALQKRLEELTNRHLLRSARLRNRVALKEERDQETERKRQEAQEKIAADQTKRGQEQLYTELGNKRQKYVDLWHKLLNEQDSVEARDLAKKQAREKKAAEQTKRGQEQLYIELGNKREKYVNTWKKLLDEQDKLTDRETRQKESKDFLTRAEGSMGGIRSGATRQGLLNVANAKAQVESLIVRGKVSATRMQELFDQIRRGATTLEILTESERKAEVALRRLTRSYENLGTTGKRTQEILLSWRSILRLQQIQILHYGISGVTRALENATRAGAEFRVKIAEIQTISQRSQQTTGAWTYQLVGLSNQFDLELLDATSAAYEAISNQIAEGARITPFLTTAFEFARTTSSSAMQSVNLLSSAINGFNLSAFQTERTAAQLFKTIEVGRVRAEQIANIFGNSVPMANALGVSMAELNAGLATLTIQGTRPDTSLTLMNNIMLKLVKPSSEMVELFKEWGVESGEAAVATYGFYGVLQKLAKEAEKGGLTRIAEIAQDMRAIRGLIGNLGGGAFQDYQRSLEAIKNAEIDYAKATEIMAENSGTALKRIRREIENTFTQEMADKVGQLILAFNNDSGESIIYYIKDMANAISNLSNLVLAIATPIASMRISLSSLLPTIVALGAGIKLNRLAMAGWDIASSNYATNLSKMSDAAKASMTPLQRMSAALTTVQVDMAGNITKTNLFAGALRGLATNALPLVAAGIAYLITKHYEHQRVLSTIADDVAETYRKANERRLKDFDNTLAAELEAVQEHSKQIIADYSKLIALQNKVIQSLGPAKSLEEIISLEEEFTSNLVSDTLPAVDALYARLQSLSKVGEQFARTGGLQEAEKVFERVAKYAGDVNDKIRNALKLIEDETKQTRKSQEDSLLERMLFGKTDANKAKILTQEIVRLVESAKTKANQGLLTGSSEDLKKAEQLSSRLIGMQDEKKKSKAGAAFDLQGSIFGEQLRIQELMAKELEKRKISELTIVNANRNLLKEQQTADEKRKQGQQEVINRVKEIDAELQKISETQSKAESGLVEATSKFSGAIVQASLAMRSLPDGNPFNKFPIERVTQQFRALGRDVTVQDLEKLMLQVDSVEQELKIAQQTEDSATSSKKRQELLELYKQIKEVLYTYDTLTEGKALFGANRDSFKRLLQDLNLYEQQLNKAQAAPAEAAALKEQLLKERETLLSPIVEEASKINTLAAQYPDIMSRLSEAANAVNTQAERTLRLENAIRDSVGVGQSNIDSLRGFATGGRHGRDNLVGRFSPNEMVMNPQASAKFGPTLSAMNTFGRTGNAGSSIVNVGDINVTAVAGPNGQLDINSLGRRIRRAIQRKEMINR